jgi:hypothetical protein
MKDTKIEERKTIKIELNETAAKQLAMFCQRTILERVVPFSSSETEAYKMMKSLDDLRIALEKQGFSPR